MPLKYPELTEREATEVKDLAERISNFVNGNSQAACKALGIAMANDHRALVQYKGNIVYAFLEQLKADVKEGRFDARNFNICQFADKVIS